MDIGFVGLGSMGAPMAANLSSAGHRMVVWNRSPEPVARAVAAGAVAGSLADVFATGVVLSILGDDRAVEEHLLDDGLLAAAPAGTIHANMGTMSVELTTRATALYAGHGLTYVAAPVFGRSSVAAEGKLTIVCAGPPEAVSRLAPAFDVLGSKTWDFGTEPARAALMKILGNVLLINAIDAVAEVVAVGEAGGIDAAAVVDLMSSTLFPGPVYGGYGGRIAARDYEPVGFRLALGLKDVGLGRQAAADLGRSLPLTERLVTALERGIAGGLGDADLATLGEIARWDGPAQSSR